MPQRARPNPTDEELEVQAAVYAMFLGIGALAFLAAAVVVGLIIA